jgi:hypothetical protein
MSLPSFTKRGYTLPTELSKNKEQHKLHKQNANFHKY